MPGLPVTRRDVSTLVRALVDSIGEKRLMIYASAVAFRTLVALIPLTLLGIALLRFASVVGAQLDELLRKRT